MAVDTPAHPQMPSESGGGGRAQMSPVHPMRTSLAWGGSQPMQGAVGGLLCTWPGVSEVRVKGHLSYTND